MMIMGESSLKRQRLPIPSHVCLVSHSQDEDENGVEYKVYLLDLNLCGSGATADDGGAVGVYTHVLPTFRFDGPNKPRALCLLASTLFIFEGYHGRYLSDGYVNRGKSALRFELFPTQDSDHRVCDMHTSKFSPCAISTPDGKRILVFSTRLILDHVYQDEDEYEADTDFELYDPCADSWLQLPRLVPSHLHFQNHEFWSVEAYSFIDHHRFFIRLCSGYMFVLDLDSLEKGWEYYQLGYASLLSWIDGYFQLINSKFVFTSEGIYDVRDEAWKGSEPSVSVPQSSFPPTDLEPFDLRAAFPSITILHHDTENGVVHWCALKFKSVPYTEDTTRSYTRLLIDVYVTHLNAKLNTRILRTLQLLIDHHNYLYNVEFLPNI